MKVRKPVFHAVGLLCCIGAVGAAAQTATSVSATAERAIAEPAPTKAAKATSGPAEASAGSSKAQLEAGEPRATMSDAPARTVRPRNAASQHGASAADHVDLDTTIVTGNQELPKVMYIVPWKKSDIGDIAGRPMNSLLDEVLAPVDRDVFRREVRYYDAVKAGAAPGSGASQTASGAGQQVEK